VIHIDAMAADIRARRDEAVAFAIRDRRGLATMEGSSPASIRRWRRGFRGVGGGYYVRDGRRDELKGSRWDRT
jgi:hypothetical protein